MKKVKLLDICNPKQWATISTDKLLKQGYPVYGANGKIGYYDKYNHEQPTLLITCRGATCGPINISEPKSYVNGNAMCLDDLHADIKLKYLYYQLLNYNFKEVISGSAQPQITREGLAKVWLNIHSLEEQKSIVGNLDKVSELIEKRKIQLEKLDLLIKSRFIEMFGDQSLNEKGFPYLTINDVAEIYLGITHTPNYVDNGVMFISAKNTSGDFLDLSEVNYISREEFESAPKGSKPKKNDVLFSRVGSNLGHPVILEENLEICTFVSLGFLRTKGNVTSNYLKHWMRDDFFATQVQEHVKGGGQPNLNTGWLKQFRIIVPELEAQEEFDNFCVQVDKSKFEIQKSLEKLEILKKSLMQQYFG